MFFVTKLHLSLLEYLMWNCQNQEDLIQLIRNFFEEINLTTEINKPFAGCYVPSKFLHQDKRVKSIMIEINRVLYMDEVTGEKNDSFVEIKSCIHMLIRQIITNFFSNFD